MTARTKKEFRILLLPWSAAVLAAFSFPVVTTLAGQMHRRYVGGLPLQIVEPLAGACIIVACLAMAALSFGLEFHHRTFGLMLVQPVERFRIWWSKMLPLIGAYMSVGTAFFAGQYLSDVAWGSSFESWNSSTFLGVVALLAGVMCSSAFWTLMSRSVIGGMVLPLAMQVLLAGIITWIVSGTSTVPPDEPASGLFPALGAGAFVYCALFMYLGWRKFSRLQWREGYTGESGIAAFPALRTKEAQSVVPRGPWASLLRKELRLHRPVFYLAALFAVCWLAAFGLEELRPAWEGRFENVFGMLLVIYLPLAWLLSGCISLGEEKRLGTWGWHLTLPVSGVRQWAVKISFALLMALALGILMPALAWPAARAPILGFSMVWWDVPPALLALPIAVFATVLSFWSVAMFGTVVRAILFTFLGAGIFIFGGIMMLILGRETLLFQWVWRWLIVEYQLQPYYRSSDWIHTAGMYIGLSLLLVLLLRQSYVHCRREPSRPVIVRCSLVLIISLFLPLWMSSDIISSCTSSPPKIRALTDNLGEAIFELPAAIKEDVLLKTKVGSLGEAMKKAKPISIEEIDRASRLTPETRRWLRGTTLQFTGLLSTGNYVFIVVTFPDGRNFLFFAPWTAT